MKNRNKSTTVYNKSVIRFVVLIMVSVVLLLGIAAVVIFAPIPKNLDYNNEILRWTKIGSVGGWIGSVFGAIALVVSLVAFALPQKIKMEASLSIGTIVDPFYNKFDIIELIVSNTGIKPFSVNGLYLGLKGKNDIMFVGLMSADTFLKAYMPKFPVRLNEGESFSYYIPKEKLGDYLRKEEEDYNQRLMIIVDEVTTGKNYFDTDTSIKDIIVV